FRTIKQLFKEGRAPFEVGVYGSGLSCERMHKNADVNYFWLAGVSTGWFRTTEFYNDSTLNWNLFQNALEVPLEVPVDTNLVNPKALGKIGAFNKDGLLGSLDDTVIRNALRFSKKAPFFKSPNGEPLIHIVEYDDNSGNHHVEARDYIEFGRMVTVLKAGPEWSKVEVTCVRNNVGTAYQGYVRSDMLVSIAKIP
ncbi:MAG: hypothetical protein WA418_35330, partial [Bradyrhizobium sp.]